MRRWLLIIVGCLFGLTVHAERLTFSIVPQQSASRLAKQWVPLLSELEKQIGYQLVFTTAADIPTFEQSLQQGRYDFAYMNPYHFVVFNQSPGYQAVAKAKDKQIKGIVVVRKDSGINAIEQLRDQTIAFPSPAAFAASILPRGFMLEQAIPFEAKYVSSHDSVYLSVAQGLYPAGGGVIRTFKAIDPRISEQLMVMWTSPGYTPHAIAVHPRVPKDRVRRLQQALVELAQTERGRALLAPLKLSGFVAAKDQDWDDVRELSINLLKQPSE